MQSVTLSVLSEVVDSHSYGFNSANRWLPSRLACLGYQTSDQTPASLSDSRQCLLSASVLDQGAQLVPDSCVCVLDCQHDIQVSTEFHTVLTALRGNRGSNVGSKAADCLNANRL
jgi:hypothetical protein